MSLKTARIGPFLGCNNRLAPHALKTEDGDYLVEATNVDLDPTGRLQRRAGYERAVPLGTGRSLFCDGERMLYADGAALVLHGHGPVASLAPASSVSYAAVNGEVFFSDGVSLQRLDAANAAHPVGIPVPTAPTASLTSGTLEPGKYLCAITYFNGVEEGGASASVSIELADAGGIHLALPPAPSGVTSVGIYVSGANSTVLMLHSVVPAASTMVNATEPANGRQCLTHFKGPMPAGCIVRHFNGRLLTAAGPFLYYSDAYAFGLTTPAQNYLPFADDIALVVPCVNGVYVVADQTYWITGLGTPDMEILPVLSYGGLARSDCELPVRDPQAGRRVGWMSAKGLVLGDAQGIVQNLQEKALDLDLTGSGASLYVEGNRRVVAVAHG